MNFSYKNSYSENKKKYRELAKTHHPDKGGSSEDFQRLQKEWEYYNLTYNDVNAASESFSPKQKNSYKDSYESVFREFDFNNIQESVKSFYNANKVEIHKTVIDFLTNQKVSRAKSNAALAAELIKAILKAI